MNDRIDLQVPDAIKQLLRTMALKQMKGTPTLDTYEIELFEWYVKETESVLTGMLSSERDYIKAQIQSGSHEINVVD